MEKQDTLPEKSKALKISQNVENLIGPVQVLKPQAFGDFISELEITSDSVVVKVRIVTNESTRRIYIDWNDLESDIISTVPGLNIDLSPVLGAPNPLPHGTYEIFHAYNEPEERKTFVQNITVRCENHLGIVDQKSTMITLTPKYKVTVYRARVRLLNPADLNAQSANFRISQTIDDVETGKWEWRPSNSFFSESHFYVLPGSHFSKILEVGGEQTRYEYNFKEKDGFANADDRGVHRFGINSRTETGTIERNVDMEDPYKPFSGYKVKIKYDIEVNLYRPLPQIGGQLTFFGN